MADQTPSIQEITNVTVDPERGTGEPAVVLPQSNLVETLNRAAQFQAENTWRKYEFFQRKLGDLYQNLNDTSALEVFTPDRPELEKDRNEVLKLIAANPRAILTGGAEMANIQEKLSALRSKATESKLNRVYNEAHTQHIAGNPMLNTEGNRKMAQDYVNQKLGERTPYQLIMPTLLDIGAFTKTTLDRVTRDWATSAAEGGKKGDKFIREMVGKAKSLEDFLKVWDLGLLTQQDQYGHSIMAAVQDMYNQLPEEAKKQYGGDLKKFWHDMGREAWGSNQDKIIDTLKNNLQANSNYLADEQLAEQKRHNQATEGLGWANLNWDKDKWRASQVGSDTMKNGATIFAERMVDRLKKLADSNGFISKDKLRQLTVEDREYLGFEAIGEPDEEGKEGKVALRPLSFDGLKDYGIQIQGDKIMVLVPKPGEDKLGTYTGKNGTTGYTGNWDNTRSTTTGNIATNRLNKQLKNAGSKELNTYLPIDMGQPGVQQDQYGGSQSSSGSSAQAGGVKGTYKAKMPNGEVITSTDGVNWFNSKGEKVQ